MKDETMKACIFKYNGFQKASFNAYSFMSNPLPLAKLDITPDDPRWIGAWWGGFLLCGALLFFSAIFMFGFPSSLSERYGNSRIESDQPMLPVSQSYEHPKPSNGVMHNHQPDSSCCDQLRGGLLYIVTHFL